MYKIVQYIAVEGSTKRQKARSLSGVEVPGLHIGAELYYIDKWYNIENYSDQVKESTLQKKIPVTEIEVPGFKYSSC